MCWYPNLLSPRTSVSPEARVGPHGLSMTLPLSPYSLPNFSQHRTEVGATGPGGWGSRPGPSQKVFPVGRLF